MKTLEKLKGIKRKKVEFLFWGIVLFSLLARILALCVIAFSLYLLIKGFVITAIMYFVLSFTPLFIGQKLFPTSKSIFK